MSPQKNLSSKEIAGLTSLVLALLTSLGSLLLKLSIISALIVLLVVFAIAFLLIEYFLNRFIDRKIKLIYKLISSTKAGKKEEFYLKTLLPKKSMEELENDVESWAGQYGSELELLKKNEEYRRDFLQNLSHELKTPIFSIQGYIDTLLGGALYNESVNMKFLENAARNVDRLVRLVDDLDEISKLESGELKLNYQNFIVQELILEVFEDLSLKAAEKKVSCQIKKGCETHISVNADKEKIRQVLTNIVLNSIKYGKNEGLIEAGIYNVDGQNMLIEISDNGEGIGEEHLPRIFERFYRTDSSRSRREGGSGLGLSICKHIIEAHGQSIHVRSKLQVGTTFGFTLKKRG
jgi:two-component system phosphate regulon sensor histidine kinase PhoR